MNLSRAMPRFIAAALLCFTIALVTGCVSADAPGSLRRDAPGVSFAVGGIIRGGGLDDAGNSGSTGDLWPPSGWQFIPGAARGEIVGVPGTPDACLTDGFCFLGAVVTMLGDLGVPLNPDPNPGPNNTPSTHFGYMATSNFFRHGDSVV